jgi:hypothetical protein
MGLEPTTPGTTNQCSNQLSYNHRIIAYRDWWDKINILYRSLQYYFKI